MAVIFEAETICYIACDSCGARTLENSDSRAEAVSDAIQRGWHRLTKWNGTEYVHQDLCPQCFERWKAEQPEDWGGWMEADVERF